MKVYISGKITGLTEEEVKRNFRAGCNEAISMGHEAVNPLNNGLPKTASWREHMVKDIEMMMGCDAVLMLSNWKKSKGARIEKHIADEMKMKVFYQTGNCISDAEIEAIKEAVKEGTGFDFDDYTITSKKRDILFPRMIFIEQMTRTGRASDNFIADLMNRKRETVLYCRGRYPDEVKFNKEFREMAHKVENILNECVLV